MTPATPATPALLARCTPLFDTLRAAPTTKIRMLGFTALTVVVVLVHLGCMVAERDLTRSEVGPLYALLAGCLGIAAIAQEKKRSATSPAPDAPEAPVG